MKRALAVSTFVFCLTATCIAGKKVAPDLLIRKDHSTLDVIVQFTSAPTERHHNRIRGLGGVLKQDLSGILNAARYSLPAEGVAELSAYPDVVYISPNRPLHASLDYANPAVNAAIAREYGWDGTGVGIALIDSGLEDRPDLNYSTTKNKHNQQSRIVYSESFLPDTLPYYSATSDDYGHGTHVAGILAGNGSKSTCSRCTRHFIGIAPNATIVNLRVLDENGNGTDSSVISAIDSAIRLAGRYNIKVINLSLGRPVYESYTLDPLCQAAERAWQSGIVVVAAAGNGGRDNSQGSMGYGTIMAPANDPYVITVGAMKDMQTTSRSDDLIASYSSKGPSLFDHIVKPDIVAPGNRVISLVRAGSTIYKDSSASVNEIPNEYYISGAPGISTMYYQLSGTSMAAPVVSGAAALLIQQDPTLTPDQVKARLMKTATKNFPAVSIAIDPVTGASYTSQYDIFTIGAGYLDIWAALNDTELAPPQSGAALSPAAVYDPESGNVSVTNAPIAVWNSSSPWSVDAVWGPSVLISGEKTNVVWGSKTNVVWGSSTAEGFDSVWGSSLEGSDEADSTAGMTQLMYGED